LSKKTVPTFSGEPYAITPGSGEEKERNRGMEAGALWSQRGLTQGSEYIRVIGPLPTQRNEKLTSAPLKRKQESTGASWNGG